MTTSSRRQKKREIIEDTVLVKDAMQVDDLGLLVNISRDGLMLFGRNNLKEGCLYQLELDAPAIFKGLNPLYIGAECLWVKAEDDDPHSWAGFHIIDMSQEAADAVHMLITI